MAAPPFETRPENLPLPALLVRVGAVLGRFRHRVAAGHGLSATSLAVLGVLAGADGPSHRELAAELGVSPATLTPVVDGLEREGALRRGRDAVDRRVVRLWITDTGRGRLAETSALVEAVHRARLPAVTAEEDAVVRRYLLAVLTAVGDEDPPPAGGPSAAG
ncbi:MAG: MarR family winged helix-turn-helix transcriptional regulator [Pseudonocardia sp.]|nr:MarR family winged helix-turn-helix transcriptional regulator [Pseudonocardia sp.]